MMQLVYCWLNVLGMRVNSCVEFCIWNQCTCEVIAERIATLGKGVRPLLLLPMYSQLPSDLQAKVIDSNCSTVCDFNCCLSTRVRILNSRFTEVCSSEITFPSFTEVFNWEGHFSSSILHSCKIRVNYTYSS